MKNIKIRYVYETEIGDTSERKLGVFCTNISDMELGGLLYLIERDKFPKIIARNMFTGMRDKKSVEIYEGDICKFSDGERYHMTAVIGFDTCCFVFKGVPLHSWLNTAGKCELEVIGNIYVHPELLEIDQ